MKLRDRETKVIWSFGRNKLNTNLLKRLENELFDGLRIVHDQCPLHNIFAFLKLLSHFFQQEDRKNNFSIMVDLVGYLQGKLQLKDVQKTLTYAQEITIARVDGTHQQADLFVETDCWEELFRKGKTVFLGNGAVALLVHKIIDQKVYASVTQGGNLYQGMEVHVPDTKISPKLTEEKLKELEQFSHLEVDYFIIPAYSLYEIENLNKTLKAWPRPPMLILGVDSIFILEKIENYFPFIDGAMIFRKKLAISTKPATVPMLTKELIQLCHTKTKLVFVESDILASMRLNPSPTRAEVSDVANIVLDAADGLVIAEDVSDGKFAEKSLEQMQTIMEDIHTNCDRTVNWLKRKTKILSEFDAIAYAAYQTSRRIQAKTLVCMTKNGHTVLKLAGFRPPVPVLAVCFSADIARKLKLVWGVVTMIIDSTQNLDILLPIIHKTLKSDYQMLEGDHIVHVMLTQSPNGQETSNLFSVQKIR